jgi:hypothetical protein
MREESTSDVQRESILSDVRTGKLSCRDAEAWALENNQRFEHRPDPAEFDPMREINWTLPMTAAWIIDRSSEAVREQWDSFRTKRVVWWGCGVDPINDDCYELRSIAPATLPDVLGPNDPLERNSVYAAKELLYALRSGQLEATGVSGKQEQRLDVPGSAWRPGLYWRSNSELRPEIIQAHDWAADTSYREFEVKRDDILSIWPAMQLSVASTSMATVQLTEPQKTLPSGFDQVDWTLEHVMAWVKYRNLDIVRDLQLPDRKRPPWYGQRYRGGLVDARSENELRNALVSEKLIGRAIRRNTDGLTHPGAWWRDHSLIDTSTSWFLSDEVMKAWKPSRIAPKIKIGPALRALTSHLKKNPSLRTKEAVAWLRAEGYPVTIKSPTFRRIWQEARKDAGLPQRADPGRPRIERSK